MKSIQIHQINPRGVTTVQVSKGTEFLQAMAQGDQISLFAIGPLSGQYEFREIHVFYTGYALPLEELGEEHRYLGTAMLRGSAPVHVFERVTASEPEQAKE